MINKKHVKYSILIFVVLFFFVCCKSVYKTRHHSSNEDLKRASYDVKVSDVEKNDTLR